ncbi:MAG TPA: hypothetical protein VND93_32385 [Myxococcales bacterium]|nr:hypothetical protein [Myxococcales bacterium]
MYVVRLKKTKAIIHMVNSRPGVDLAPEQVFPGFDPKTMELGRYHEQHVPEHFEIEDGVIKSLDKAPKAPAVDLEALKEAKLREASQRSFQLRQKLIPEHELLNAALGIYPAKRTKEIQETVKAFRDEYHRFEEKLKKAKTKKDVEALEVKFPAKLVS